MNLTVVKKLPLKKILRSTLLTKKLKAQVQRDRVEINNILTGRDNRLLMIVGPCSAWPSEAVLDYAKKLAQLNEELKTKIKLVMRVYVQKPRTRQGWMGPLNQPNPNEIPDIERGIRYSREMMLHVLELNLPIGSEVLFVNQASLFLEFLSWAAIGARSSENQEHRVLASALDCAVGLKNPTHGAVDIAINSVIAAQQSYTFIQHNQEVKSHGNPYAHLILRGGQTGPNYTNDYLHLVMDKMKKFSLSHPAVLIDASHDNCILHGTKRYDLQPDIIFEVLDNLKHSPLLKKMIKGFMIESFLKEGKQLIGPKLNLEGLSITDPCIGWDKTATFLIKLNEYLA